MDYKEMFEVAADKTAGYYKGYTGGNALSLYVSDKFGVNSATTPAANNALCSVVAEIKNNIKTRLKYLENNDKFIHDESNEATYNSIYNT